jgi:cysteine desulfurase
MEKQGFEITYLPVGSNGIIDPADLRKAITAKTVMVTIHYANNEIGTIQPVEEIGKITKEKDILFHTDAVQTFGHLDIDVKNMNIDMLSLSAHKLYGPKGIGALYVGKETPFESFIHGGGQEKGRRASTHNVTGIVGLGKAAQIAGQEMHEENRRIQSFRNMLLNRIVEENDGVHLNGDKDKRLSNNINLSIENVEGESLIMNLDLEGIAASSGSACSAGSSKPSHVLTGLGLSDELLRGSLRLSLGRFTTQEEIDITAEKINKVVTHLRSLSPFGKES